MKNTKHIKKGYGFAVGQNFARAAKDTPIELAPAEYARPGCVIGYIAEDPAATLGFLKYGSKGRVRVHVLASAIGESENYGETEVAGGGFEAVEPGAPSATQDR
jgi:hypothetical protein